MKKIKKVMFYYFIFIGLIFCNEFDYPVLRISKMKSPPLIDGKILDEEWKEASAVTGFLNFGYPPHSLPNFLQPVWYIGYDDNYLYLAFKYPIYPPGSLKAKAKTKKLAESNILEESILLDDHTEIQICNIGRENALKKYFYKFMTNPWDVVSDQKVQYSIGQMGYEYETDTILKSYFDESIWMQEIAIPLKDLDVKKIQDETKWVLQLVSAQDPGGNYYAWAPYHWLYFDKHPEVIFDSKAVSFQFLSLGDWMNGNLELKFKIFNSKEKKEEMKFFVEIENPNGENIFKKEISYFIDKGEEKFIEIKEKNLQIEERKGNKDNKLKIKVLGEGDKLYYFVVLPFIPEKSDLIQNYIKNLKVGRKKVEPQIYFAYLPYFNILEANCDVGVLGIDENIRKNSKYFKVSFGKGNEIIGLNTDVINKDGNANLIFKFLPLKEGVYWINMEILDENGNIIFSKKDEFERKFFPWERNSLGKENILVKPYEPISIKENKVLLTSGEYTIAKNGLPFQITNKLVPENQNILSRPIKIFINSGKDNYELSGKTLNFDRISNTECIFSSKGSILNIETDVKGNIEFDGQYLINMNLIPKGKNYIENMCIEIPVLNPVDVINIYSPENSEVVFNNINPYKKIKNGIIWSNLDGKIKTPYIVYIGNRERGIYWYTDSYENWHIRKNKKFFEIEKKEKETILRIYFVNEPYTIEKSRNIKFAFLSVPTKPLPKNFRKFQWDPEWSHAGGGSWWGTVGCFVFPQKDEEWFYGLKNIPFVYKNKKIYSSGFFPIPFPKKADDEYILEKEKLEKGYYGVYRAADLIGYLNPEFKIFAGEWTGRNNPPLQPDPSLLNRKNKDGTPLWEEPEQRSIYVKDPLCESFYDFELWYFYQMAKNTKVGGYWWDWRSLRRGNSLIKGTAFINDFGEIESKTNLFLIRDFYKRIAKICDILGIPNTNNVYAPGPVYQVSWITRINAWETLYLETPYDDMFDAHGVDKYASIIGKFSKLPTTIVMNINKDDPRFRTVIALSLLHDNGIYGYWDKEKREFPLNILNDFGYFSDDTEWIPYWRSRKIIKSSNDDILITVYKRKENIKEKFLLCIVNPENKDINADIQLFIRKNLNITDAETGLSLPYKLTSEKCIIKNIIIKKHDLKLIKIESK